MSRTVPTRRIRELDALRGLAALSVVFNHYVNLIEGTRRPDLQHVESVIHGLSKTPLNVIWAGSQAVMFFFVLSGFALAVMMESRALGYGKYAVKRIARLYIPYAVCVGIAAVFIAAFGSTNVPTLGTWVNEMLGVKVTLRTLLGHALFIGHHDARALDFVTWTLVQEMRISLLFPLIWFCVTRYDWRVVLPVTVAISLIASAICHYMVETRFGVLTTYVATFHYACFFVVGAMLARYFDELGERFSRLSPMSKAVLLVAAVVSYGMGRMMIRAVHVTPGLATEWADIPGTCIIILAAGHSARVSRVLMLKPLQFLGHTSFSLYLWHGVIMLWFARFAFDRWSTVFLLACAFVTTIVVSTLSWKFVERPAITLGNRLTARPPRSEHQPAPAAA